MLWRIPRDEEVYPVDIVKALSKMPPVRLFGNSVLSFIIKASSGYWNVMDPTNGFFAIAAHTLRALDLDKLDKRYFFETDMLINLYLANKVVTDIPMPAIYANETSNLKIRRVIFSFSYKIVRSFIRRLLLRYYIHDFNMASVYFILSVPLLLFGVTMGIYRWRAGIIENTDNNPGAVVRIKKTGNLQIMVILLCAFNQGCYAEKASKDQQI